MTVVVLLALAGLIALLVAVLTGSTAIALVVIAFAALGIALLFLDWRKARVKPPANAESPLPDSTREGADPSESLRADMFKPDISTDPDGPSSNARAD